MKKSYHFYASLGISDEDIRVYNAIVEEIKHGYFNEDHIRLLDNDKALKYIIAEGEYEVFVAIIRVFSYEKDEMIRRRYLVDPYSRNIVEFINKAYTTYSEAIETAQRNGVKDSPNTIVDNSVIIKPEYKEYLLKAIYDSYPKKDVDKNVISDVLAREISGWRHPIKSEKDVIKYSEISNLYPSLELYRKNIMTTYNDTNGCYDDMDVKDEPFVEIRINYDTLDEENKLYADLLEKSGKAKFVQEADGRDLSLFIYCRRDEYVKDVSDRMFSLIAGFKKQDMIYGRISTDKVREDILVLAKYVEPEVRDTINNMWNQREFNRLFDYIGLDYFYDPEERQFWLDKCFYDKHIAFINNQRTIDTDAKLEKKRPSED